LGYKTPEEFRLAMGYGDVESKERFPQPHNPDDDEEINLVPKRNRETPVMAG